jgi:small subunit ribosomal protein S8
MAVTDQIADFLTRIRNGGNAGHRYVSIPRSNMKVALSKILLEQGFIAGYQEEANGVQGEIKVELRYFKKKPAFNQITRVSKPGRRIYVPSDQIPRVKNGLGMAIISTSRGVLTDKEARKHNVGGEVICTVW